LRRSPRRSAAPEPQPFDPQQLKAEIGHVLLASLHPMHQAEIQKKMRHKVPIWEILQALHHGPECFVLQGIGSWRLTEEWRKNLPPLPERPPEPPAGLRLAAVSRKPAPSPKQVSAPRPPVTVDAHLVARALEHLRDRGRPLPNFQLNKWLGDAGLVFKLDELCDQVDAARELVRYPYGMGRWIGLAEWGEAGYVQGAEAQWEVSRAQLMQICRGEKANVFDTASLHALRHLAEKNQDEAAGEAVEKVLRQMAVGGRR
jgi:hypothetical protein